MTMFRTAMVCVACVSLHAPAQPATPTLKQIMADPAWIARSPQGAFFTPDGEAIVYRRDRAGSDLSDTFRATLDAPDKPSVVDDADLPWLAARPAWNTDRTAYLFTHAGDVFLHDLAGGERRQLTRTTAGEGGAAFMVDGSVMFGRDGSVFIRDLATGAEREAADVRMSDDPDADDAEKNDKEPPYLEAQQERLFDIIRSRKARGEEAAQRRREIVAADATRVPGPFYLGDAGEVRTRELSPNGRWMIVVVAEKAKPGRRDVMPVYVSDDGYVQQQSVRVKVGEDPRPGSRVFVLDLERETHHELDPGVLPSISDDPLAWLRRERGLDAIKGPRDITVGGVRWSRDGSRVVLMARSTDNKDRWIAAVDLDADKPAFVPVHHLRDEAWINGRYNEFGWLRDGRGLWFMSEESGHGHVYVWDAETGETTQRTAGTFQVSDVLESPDGRYLYFRTNRFDPTIYELERYDLRERTVEQMTLRGGSVDGFELSPSGERILLTWSTAMDPPELFLMDARPLASVERLTFTDEDLYRSFDWVEPRFVAVPSTHADRPIRCRVYIDEDAPIDGDRPVVFFIHGAGYLQHVYRGWSNYYREHMFHTLLARRGFVVVAPDFRASAGYGRDWRTAIYRQMGTPELEDLEDCLAWLAREMPVDRERVGLYGGSYGGFVTLMAMFKRPELFKAGAALRSVTDWAHYNDGYTANILNTPDLDPEAYERSSPIEFAEGLDGALLMCHGMADDNVVAQDTIRLAQRLIELEKDNWEVALYPIEPHGFREPTGWLDEYRRILALFERELTEARALPSAGSGAGRTPRTPRSVR